MPLPFPYEIARCLSETTVTNQQNVIQRLSADTDKTLVISANISADAMQKHDGDRRVQNILGQYIQFILVYRPAGICGRTDNIGRYLSAGAA